MSVRTLGARALDILAIMVLGALMLREKVREVLSG